MKRGPFDKTHQHLVDAFAEYVRTFEAAQRSDGSDLTAHLHQLIEAIAGANRAMLAGVFVTQFIERTIGSPPALPALPTDPVVEAQYRDDRARWVMQAWQIMIQVFLLQALGSHPMLDALHNDADRGLTGGVLQFFKTLAPQHGNTRDVLRRTARDAMVFSVILAAAELNGKDRIERVLADAGIGLTERGFTAMRQSVSDKAALARMTEEAKRRANHRVRPAAQSAPMTASLIAGAITTAEQLALYPGQYPDLAGFRTASERIRYLFGKWNGDGG